MADVGAPTLLTEELTLKIRQQVLEGVNYKVIQSSLDINENTWDTWVYKNYQGFRDTLMEWKKERLIRKAEKLSDEILDAEHIDEKGKLNTDIIRVKQKESEFVRETLGKDVGYSKRNELTGKNGEALAIAVEDKEKITKALDSIL